MEITKKNPAKSPRFCPEISIEELHRLHTDRGKKPDFSFLQEV
jgi:hypothetical protein